MNRLVNFIIAVLAAFRLTELIVKDEGPYMMFSRFRRWTGKKAASGNTHYITLAEAVYCVFCIGVYAAFIIMILPKPVKYVIAVAGGQSLIESALQSKR